MHKKYQYIEVREIASSTDNEALVKILNKYGIDGWQLVAIAGGQEIAGGTANVPNPTQIYQNVWDLIFVKELVEETDV